MRFGFGGHVEKKSGRIDAMSKPLGRARVLRRDRRSRLQEDLSRAAGDGPPRPARRPGHRRGQVGLDARAAHRARARSRDRARRRCEPGGVSRSWRRSCATSTATTTTRTRSRSCKAELDQRASPIHYLAIPPSMFPTVIGKLAEVDCTDERARHRREAVRPRSRVGAGAEPRAARGLPRGVRSSASITTSARRRCRTSCTSASPTRSSSRSGIATTSRTCRSRWPRASASRAAASSTKRPASSATSSRTTCSRS